MQAMPQVAFGKYYLSRLIVGSNTINGGSHLSRFTNLQMRNYFTTERVLEHLRACRAAGVNAWQSISGNLGWYAQLQDAGESMHFISLGWDWDQEPNMLENLHAAGAIGIAHHGEFTDIYWRNQEMHKVQAYLKRIRDMGMVVGVSTHIPEVVQHIEDAGWDVDFFMCCVYERHRTKEELLKLLGHVPIPLQEVYLEDDPARMFSVMQQTDKPCLAFKILAAGRLCDRQETVEEAFRSTFSQIKANDAVIVGMYPEYEDQVVLNTEYVRRFSHLSRPAKGV